MVAIEGGGISVITWFYETRNLVFSIRDMRVERGRGRHHNCHYYAHLRMMSAINYKHWISIRYCLLFNLKCVSIQYFCFYRDIRLKKHGKFSISNRLFYYISFHSLIKNVQKKAMGNDLYEQVFYSLDLIEKDYFGLQFTDANHVKHWLDPTKTVKKQVKSMYDLAVVGVALDISIINNHFLSVFLFLLFNLVGLLAPVHAYSQSVRLTHCVWKWNFIHRNRIRCAKSWHAINSFCNSNKTYWMADWNVRQTRRLNYVDWHCNVSALFFFQFFDLFCSTMTTNVMIVTVTWCIRDANVGLLLFLNCMAGSWTGRLWWDSAHSSGHIWVSICAKSNRRAGAQYYGGVQEMSWLDAGRSGKRLLEPSEMSGLIWRRYAYGYGKIWYADLYLSFLLL